MNMMVSSYKLKRKQLETMILIGTDSIQDPTCEKSTSRHGLNHCGTRYCEESELLFDLKNKHLKSFGHQVKKIQPTTLNKACQGDIFALFYFAAFITKLTGYFCKSQKLIQTQNHRSL